MKYQVVITDCPWQDISIEEKILSEIGAEVRRFQCGSPEEVIAAAQDADALLLGWAPITKAVVEALPKCRIMVRYGVGYNNVDVDAATAAGIAVANNPDYCMDEVATHALALVLACHRQLSPLMTEVRAGAWDPTTMKPMPRLNEQTVGIIGYGRIGRRFAGMIRPLVKRVVAYDPMIQESDGQANMLPLEDVLRSADYLSIHAPLTIDTEHLIRAETLSLMKSGAFLVNCSRGQIVDETALVAALRAGTLGGAALDVFETEPLPKDDPLREFSNVIITPHAAWFSQTADYELRANPSKLICEFLLGKPVRLLNVPRARQEL